MNGRVSRSFCYRLKVLISIIDITALGTYIIIVSNLCGELPHLAKRIQLELSSVDYLTERLSVYYKS